VKRSQFSTLALAVTLSLLKLPAAVAYGPAAIDTSNWRQWQLPGNVGTVTLPPDWRTTANDQFGAFEAAGPGGVAVHMGLGGELVDPRSPFASPSQYGVIVVPYGDLVSAVEALVPQLSRANQLRGLPGITRNGPVRSSPAQSKLGGPSALIEFDITKSDRPEVVRVLGYMTSYPLNNGVWGYWTYYAEAPRETLTRNLPVLIAIAESWRPNGAVTGQNVKRYADAQNAIVEDMIRRRQ